MMRRSLYFVAPGRVEVQEEELAAPAPGEVLVEARLSAIAAGTERLFYRGEATDGPELDEALRALCGGLRWPFKYGCGVVGRVVEVGQGVERAWLDRRVVVFHAHESHFTCRADALVPIPDGVGDEAAVFLPSMETSLRLATDGAPLVGERVVVLGQGVVGLLTTALLARFPLEALVVVEPLAARRELATALGATAAVSSDGELRQVLGAEGADLCFEISGRPAALDLAIAACRTDGRIVVGSWYGSRKAPIDLGGAFRRRNLRLVGSHVGHVFHPQRSGWSRARWLDVAWRRLRGLEAPRFVTHRFRLEEAPAAYRLLEEPSSAFLQLLLSYR